MVEHIEWLWQKITRLEQKVDYLQDINRDLYVALQSILEIGKRDTTNSKYDGYWRTAKEAIARAKGSL